jgi:hypothetical protein
MREMLLLGAGASFSAGVPMAFAMTEEVLKSFHLEETNALKEAEKNPDEDYYKGVAEGIQKKLLVMNYVLTGLKHHAAKQGKVVNQIDIEQFIGALESLATRKDSDISPFINSYSWDPKVDEFDELVRTHVSYPANGGYDGLANEIKWKVWDLVKIEHNSNVNYLRPLLNILNMQQGLTITTLNYDNTIETLCEQNNVFLNRPPMESAYISWERERQLKSEGGYETYRQEIDYSATNKITLLKLHGSFDWQYSPLSPSPYKLYRKHVIKYPNDAPSRYHHIRYEPTIILKRGNKLSTDEPYPELINHFIQELQLTNTLTIIGYSFRDEHINTIIGRWYDTGEKKIQIVDPGFSSNIEGFKDTLFWQTQEKGGNIKLIQEPADKALKILYGD